MKFQTLQIAIASLSTFQSEIVVEVTTFINHQSHLLSTLSLQQLSHRFGLNTET